jgi:hypothetical protein
MIHSFIDCFTKQAHHISLCEIEWTIISKYMWTQWYFHETCVKLSDFLWNQFEYSSIYWKFYETFKIIWNLFSEIPFKNVLVKICGNTSLKYIWNIDDIIKTAMTLFKTYAELMEICETYVELIELLWIKIVMWVKVIKLLSNIKMHVELNILQICLN